MFVEYTVDVVYDGVAGIELVGMTLGTLVVEPGRVAELAIMLELAVIGVL